MESYSSYHYHPSLRGHSFKYSVQDQRRAEFETDSLDYSGQPDDAIGVPGNTTNLPPPTPTPADGNSIGIETATYSNATTESTIGQPSPQASVTITKKMTYSKVDTIITLVMVAWSILLTVKLAICLYKHFHGYLVRWYHNSERAKRRQKQRRYETIDQWLVTKAAQPHDWVCGVTQTEREPVMRNEVTNCVEFGESGRKVIDASSIEHSDDDPHRFVANDTVFVNVQLRQKMGLTCLPCQNDEKKQPKTTRVSTNLILGKSEQQHGDDDGSCVSDSHDVEEDEKLSCSICLERFRVGDAVSWSPSELCSHVYHHACIRDWLSGKIACPYCRVTVLPVDRVMEKEQNNDDTTTTTVVRPQATNITPATETPPTTADETATTTINADDSSSTSTLQSESKESPALSRDTTQEPSNNDLAKERLSRLQTTYFCVDCGLVTIGKRAESIGKS